MIGYSNSALYLQNPGLAQALRRQAFAQQLATSATGSEPIRAHTQGLNKLAQAGLAALLMNRADSQFGEMAKKQEAERESFGALVGQMLSGGSGAQPAPAPQGGAPGIAPQAPGGVQVPPGIHMNESSGSMRPGIFGDGGLAAGPMQVHAAALADVNRRLGTNYTHQQLASDPQVGKLVGDEYWRMQHEKFGDPVKATAAYNAGPGRVAAAIQADPNNWQAGIPEATRGYVNRVHGNGQAAPQAPAPQGGGMPDPNAELAKAQQMQMLGMQGMRSSDPTTKQQGEAVFQMGKQLETRALQIMAQQQARAERPMQTVTMQDPNGGGVGIYEMTPNGPGRRVGAAPRQPGESSGPFAGTGMDAQANNVLLAIGPKIAAGNATEAERAQYALAYEHVAQGKISMVPDPSDPTGQRQMMGRIPGAVPQQFPPPGGAPGSPGSPVPIPGTQAPTTTAGDRSKLKAMETEVSGITSSLDKFMETRGKAGVGERLMSVAGQPTELNTTYNVAALLAKGEVLFNLGVLNGPDLEIIRRTLPDPATMGGAMASQETVKKQVQVIKDLIESRMKTAREQMGGVKSESQGSLKFNPATGRIE